MSELRALVAGIGNVFLGDDGFGPAVIQGLDRGLLPLGVDAQDFGIRGVHLAYEIIDRQVPILVLVDAVPLGEPPGTLAVIDVDGPGLGGAEVDAHSMTPTAVLSAVAALGAPLPRVVVVGCQPADFDQGMSLSEPVAASLDRACRLTIETVQDLLDPLRAVS